MRDLKTIFGQQIQLGFIYAWVKLLKEKQGKTVLNAFFKTVYESNHKPNKLWFDQG